MRIILRLSKNADLDLYSYFRDVEYQKSTHAKMLLRDFIYKQHTVRIRPPRVTADAWQDATLPKGITIPIYFGLKDSNLEEYFFDVPSGLRVKCAKSMLRAILAPYTQCAFHCNGTTETVTYPEASMAATTYANESSLSYAIQTMQMMMQTIMMQKDARTMETFQGMPPFMNHRPDFSSTTLSESASEPPASLSGSLFSELEQECERLETKHENMTIPVQMPVIAPKLQGDTGVDATDNDADDTLMKLFGVDY